MGTEESALLWEQMDMDAITREFEKLFPSFSFDGKAVLTDLLQGRIWEALQKLGHAITDAIVFRNGEYRTLFFTILILGVAAALFAGFTDLFQDHQVSDLAFYFIYLLLVAVLLKFFAATAGTVREILNNVTTFIRLYIPTYILVVGSASGAASAAASYQLLLFAVYLIEWGFLVFLLPIVQGYVLLAVINGVWMEEKLALLLELLEKGIAGGIKTSLWLVTGFSLLQSMITPVIDSLHSGAFKKALSSLPGVGGLTEGMFEMVLGSAVLLRNSLGLYLTLLLILLCAVPVLKIALTACVIKVSAALIGIISDKRLTNCVSRVGEGNLMLLKLTLTCVGMFLIQVAVISYSTGQLVH
ncbi:MAG: stage III sporulation protein AE [Bacteroidales bacterium]|nr:stage III sporulation protein AE [Bacteroidales bacterium]MCM1415482.1 stage III sporulation protein AE [bacterium]MCM1423419.1 stage III sporulation protein AE [bacterium]